MKLTIHEVAQVVGAKNDISLFEDTQLEKAEFDSRLIAAGDLFVPLKGARDGHDFIETAFEKWCRSKPCLRKKSQIIPTF